METDIVFTYRAAAGYLQLKLSGLRMAVWRGKIREESRGLVSLDELEKYLLKYRRKKLPKFVPPPEGLCRRCGQLDNTGLCEWCQKELKSGHYTWYVDLA